MRRTTIIFLALVAALAGACGEENEVGSGVKVGGGGAEESGLRLGERTTTTEAPAAEQKNNGAAATTTTAPKAATNTTVAAAVTTAPPTTTAAQVLVIKIANRSEYDPPIATVAMGQLVRWVNEDSIERQIVASDQAFASPKIPPGGSWEWKANKRGNHPYADPDVPFAAGARIEVQ